VTVDAETVPASGSVAAIEPAFSDQLLDELLPEDLEWREVVRAYPLSSLVVAAVGGYFIGRRSGQLIVEAFSRAANDRVVRVADGLLSDE